jgi:putative transposase
MQSTHVGEARGSIWRLADRAVQTELINRRGPWRTVDEVEIATLEWVDWFNNRRLHTSCADLTPAEYEQVHYRQHPALAETLVPTP